jgi:hypothetical protein
MVQRAVILWSLGSVAISVASFAYWLCVLFMSLTIQMGDCALSEPPGKGEQAACDFTRNAYMFAWWAIGVVGYAAIIYAVVARPRMQALTSKVAPPHDSVRRGDQPS